MGYKANERGKLSEDFVAAGDGLGAFGAVFILSVQTHCQKARAAAEQWICARKSHARADLKADNQDHKIQN
jgi:hypothetical protein